MTVTNTSLLGLALPTTGTESGVWGDDVNNGLTILIDVSVAGTNNITQDSDITLSVSNGNNSSTFTSTATNSTVAQYYVLNCTGARGAIRNIIAPASSRTFVVINNTTGGFAIVIKKSGGTGVSIAPNETAIVYYDSVTATDYVKVSSTVNVSSFSAGTTGFTPSTATTGAVTLAGTLNVANGGTGVTTSTGTGSVVLNTSPTLVTPALGTPSSVTLTNATGLPISTGLSGLTTNGVAYATSTSALATGSTLGFDGTNLYLGTTSNSTFVSGTNYVMNATTGLANKLSFTVNNSAVSYVYANASATAIGYPSGGSLQFQIVGGGTVGTFNSSGYLGIGTSSPNAALNVQDSTANNGTIWLGSGTYYSTIKNDATVTGALLFNVATANGGATTYQWQKGGTAQMVLDSSGNLGLGTTPNAWQSGFSVLDLGGSNSAITSNNSSISVFANTYKNSSGNYIYKTSSYASGYTQYAGQHIWNTAGTGTAGGTISFTQAMTLDNSGNLLVGTTTSPSGSGKIQAPKGLTGTPTFKVTSSGTQAVTANTLTKITNWTTSSGWDTSSSFDFTNKRYTPNVAGYYQVNTCIPSGQAGTATNGANTTVSLYLNGGFYASMTSWNNGGANDQYQLGSAIVYMNGSTDYIEVYFTCSSNVNVNSGVATRFEAFLARGA